MIDQLPEVQREIGCISLTFPARDPSGTRVFAIVLLVIGLALSGFMIFWMWGPMSSGLRHSSGFRWLEIGFGLLGLPPLLIGIGLMLAGIRLLSGTTPRCTVWLGDEVIRIRETFGAFFWTWRIPVAELTAALVTGEPRFGGMVVLRRGTGRDVWVAPGYPGPARALLIASLAAAMPRLRWYVGEGNGPAPGTLRVQEDAAGFTVTLPDKRRLSWRADGLHLEPRSGHGQHWTPDQITGCAVEDHGEGSGRYKALTLRGSAGKPVEIRRLGRAAERWLMQRIASAREGRPVAAAQDPAHLAQSARAEVPGDPIAEPAGVDSPPCDPTAALPADSPIRCAADGADWACELPPRGVFRRTSMFPLGLIFAVIGLGAVIGVWIFSVETSARLVVSGFGAFFSGIGVLIGVSGLRSGTRRTLLAVRGGVLTVSLRDLVGLRTLTIAPGCVRRVRVEPTGTQMNDHAFYRLVIVRSDGPEVRFGEECSPPELEAVASRLRAALR